jgi:hypothetical protein
MTKRRQPQNSATEPVPASLRSFEPQWAVTPKLTMINGRQLPSGRFRCESSVLDLTVACDCQIASMEIGYIVENKQKIVESKSVTGWSGAWANTAKVTPMATDFTFRQKSAGL